MITRSIKKEVASIMKAKDTNSKSMKMRIMIAVDTLFQVRILEKENEISTAMYPHPNSKNTCQHLIRNIKQQLKVEVQD